MTDLTKEQEAALVEAIANGSSVFTGMATAPGPGDFWDYGGRYEWFLTPVGLLLAQALKERDEARAKTAELSEEAAESSRLMTKAQLAFVGIAIRLADIQTAMHSAGYKSAAAMLNPLLRGDDE